MSLFKNKKRRPTFGGLILFSFSIMVAFSIYLHDHDLFAADEDCAPCQWAQISVNLDSGTPSLEFIPITFSNELKVASFHHKNFKYFYFGLSPPAFS